MGRYARAGYPLLIATTLAAQNFTVLDVQSVPAEGDPLRALVAVRVPANPRVVRCDVLVVGAGMGGVAAALAASDRGHSVCLTEETDWVGGQATAGGVSALDENRFIEFAGGTRSYYEFRNRIREAYRKNYKLTEAAAKVLGDNSGQHVHRTSESSI